MSRSKRFAVLAAVAVLSVLSRAHAADLLVSSELTSQVLRYHGTTGAFVGAFVPAGANGLSAPAGVAFNLIVDNGTAAGTTGGRFGLFHESTAPATGLGTRQLAILRHNMFYGNRAGDIGNVIQTLDAGDSGNFTTRRNEAAICLSPGCPLAIAGCTFADCGVAHPLTDIFADPAAGNFRLAAGSPAFGAGVDSLFHGGTERVPADDFDGDPRPDDLPAIGFDEGP